MVIISLIFIVALCISFFSNILRDRTGNPIPIEFERAFQANINNDPRNVKPPFSLSRTQLTLWITIISSVYVYAVLWDNRALLEINNTALLLMGISGGTFAIGAILDTIEIQQNITRHQDDFDASSNFFEDILKDNNGLSIHRFQNVVWTVIAIVIYFYRYNNPSKGDFDTLPELDATLLALTGISSATYLTLKARENISLQKLVILKIKLVVDNIPEKDLIDNSADGLKNAVIDITGSKGSVVHAIPGPTDPRFTFEATVEPRQLQKIDANWKGKIGNADIELTGSSEKTINTIPEDNIIILMKKK